MTKMALGFFPEALLLGTFFPKQQPLVIPSLADWYLEHIDASQIDFRCTMSVVQCTFNMTAEPTESGPTDEDTGMAVIGEIMFNSTSEARLAARNEIADIVSNGARDRPSLTRQMLKLGSWHGAAFRADDAFCDLPELAAETPLGSTGEPPPNAPPSRAFRTHVEHKLLPRARNQTRKPPCWSAASRNGNLRAVACGAAEGTSVACAAGAGASSGGNSMPLVMLVINAESVEQVREPVSSREHSIGPKHPLIPDILLTRPITFMHQATECAQEAIKRNADGIILTNESFDYPQLLPIIRSLRRLFPNKPRIFPNFTLNHPAGGSLHTNSWRGTGARAAFESNRFTVKMKHQPDAPRAFTPLP
jgi:hypothetical protein